jgi:HSP20 family protein
LLLLKGLKPIFALPLHSGILVEILSVDVKKEDTIQIKKNEKGGIDMALIRRKNYYNPFRELEDLQRDMNELFNFSLSRGIDRDTGLLDGAWSPAIDVHEGKDNYVVKADLPGLKKEDLDITVQNNHLILKGEKKYEESQDSDNAIRTERFYGSFYRSLALPTEVDGDNVKASYKNGTLELTLPKKEEAKPKQITVDIK